MIKQNGTPWRECCPNCGSHSFYIVIGKYKYNPTKTFRRGYKKPKPHGYRCRKCKTYFSTAKDKLLENN